MSSRGDVRSEWVQGHLAEATRIATLLTADPARGPVVAREALDAALEQVPRRRLDGRLADALLAQLVRHSKAEPEPAPPDLPEQLAALRTLPRRQRAALVLRHYAELSDERAAVFLDCSPKAVADLVGRAVRALPAEARSDLHDWLDAAPLPRAAAARPKRSGVRRVFRPRVVRAIGVTAAVAAGIAGGLRIPALVDEPEPPTRAERLAEIRQVLESREASLPFDPDDPGPGASPMFPVVDGVIGGNLWNVMGYRDRTGSSCLQLVVDYDFGRRRCLGPAEAPIRATVDVDRQHGVTFISGMVAPEIAELHFVGPTVSWMDVTIGRENPRAQPTQPGFFGIALPDELVAVPSRRGARAGGYDVYPARLTGIDGDGRGVAKVTLLLTRT
ncbi:MAG TPA: sigma factor-like helix-turn-helix DNA-binding protein [Actinomycetota bacterium]|nr:sigma factor-like helix-turn-helix DNA-binding protein [Actinomycetota bacterium]